MLLLSHCSFYVAPHTIAPRVTPPIVPFTLRLFLHTHSSHVVIPFALSLLLHCYNHSLELKTKARACKGASQVWNLGITFHDPGSVGKCEGMNPHTPNWIPTLGIIVMMDIFGLAIESIMEFGGASHIVVLHALLFFTLPFFML
jgi:hypothetical protein